MFFCCLATAYLDYHIVSALSTTFFIFFSSFFEPLLPCSATRLILSFYFPLVNIFFDIFLTIFKWYFYPSYTNGSVMEIPCQQTRSAIKIRFILKVFGSGSFIAHFQTRHLHRVTGLRQLFLTPRPARRNIKLLISHHSGLRQLFLTPRPARRNIKLLISHHSGLRQLFLTPRPARHNSKL